MNHRTLINVVACLCTLAALAWLFIYFNPQPPDVDARLHEAVGETLAVEALKLLEPGARLVTLARDPVAFRVPAAEAQMEGFLRAVEKAGKKVTAARWLKQDPLRVAGVPPGEFFDLLRQGKPTDVIVSFLGPPVLDAEQIKKLAGKRSRIVALCSGAMPTQVNLRRVVALGFLHMAIIDQPDAPARASAGNARAAFAQMFKIITPANASELPALAAIK